MTFEGAFEITGFEFPDFDGTVFGSGGELSVLGVEGKRSDIGLVSFELVLGRGFGEEEVFEVEIFMCFIAAWF